MNGQEHRRAKNVKWFVVGILRGITEGGDIFKDISGLILVQGKTMLSSLRVCKGCTD
jgi:hypothetical protein